uniref:Uncharacterized protein n=1 Tax=Arabidopsis thaliana TaxID=3702 RepID=Q0WPC4_ARATH|nr:hypothetical protein [Arabidopsis thaliana]
MGRGKADGELIQPRRSEDREQADLYHAASGFHQLGEHSSWLSRGKFSILGGSVWSISPYFS